jgi:hypothetical protein
MKARIRPEGNQLRRGDIISLAEMAGPTLEYLAYSRKKRKTGQNMAPYVRSWAAPAQSRNL